MSLSKILDKHEEQLGYTFVNQFAYLKGLQFYNWSPNGKIDASSIYQSRDFNHAIGLPQKNGISYPQFDYERMLFDTLQSNKHVWIKKATGLGVTELMLRYMAWLCFTQKNLDVQIAGSQMCIVTGPQNRVSHNPDR